MRHADIRFELPRADSKFLDRNFPAMRLPISLILFCLSSTCLLAARDTPGGALNAIDQLPRGEYKKIARIEARDGTPLPERWHIIVHDPKDENGVREYVVAGGELVASRAISQFVETVKPDEVVSSGAVKVDSDKVAKLAQAYAQANNVNIATLNYMLKKEGAEAVPLWNVSCLDETGKEVGKLVVSAGKGTVVSHEGFTAEPGAEVLLETQATPTERKPRKPVVVNKRPAATPAPEKKSVFGKFGEFFTGRPNGERR